MNSMHVADFEGRTIPLVRCCNGKAAVTRNLFQNFFFFFKVRTFFARTNDIAGEEGRVGKWGAEKHYYSDCGKTTAERLDSFHYRESRMQLFYKRHSMILPKWRRLSSSAPSTAFADNHWEYCIGGAFFGIQSTGYKRMPSALQIMLYPKRIFMIFRMWSIDICTFFFCKLFSHDQTFHSTLDPCPQQPSISLD